jgi:hypothetical protein
MNKMIDFDDDFNATNNKIKLIKKDIDKQIIDQINENEEIEKMIAEINKLADEINLRSPNNEVARDSLYSLEEFNSWVDNILVDSDLQNIYKDIEKEVYKNPKLLPKLTHLDMAIICLAGVVGTVLDFLVVKIPKDTKYLRDYNQKGSELTKWLRSLGVNEDGKLNDFLSWLEKICKVPYDKSISDKVEGMYPKNHRLLSLAHDPLFGLIFSILDIYLGTMTSFDTNGVIHIIKNYDTDISKKILAPLVWIGHLVSDVCTKAGIPIPGWGFLQLLQFGKFGDKGRTIAEISEYMYLKGYDLRHFVTMSVSTASVNMIIRGYHFICELDKEEKINNINISIVDNELNEISSKLKLHKMFFLANAIASSGNAIKVFSPVYHGNPTAINLPQWLVLLKESITMLNTVTRDTTVEKIVRNREKIESEWEALK